MILLKAFKFDFFRSTSCQLFCAVAFLRASSGSAQEYGIYPPEKNNQIELTAFDSTNISLLLTKKKKQADTISLILSAFKGQKTGEEIKVTLSISEDSSGNKIRQFHEDTSRWLSANETTRIENVIVDKAVLPLSLHIPRLPSYQDYSGNLIISRFQEQVMSFQITLHTTPEFIAELAVDLPSSSQKYMRPFFGKHANTRFIWHVYEKGRKEKLKGVYAVLQDYSSSNDHFYPKTDLQFFFNEKPIHDFWGLASRNISSRTIEIGEQAEIIAQIGDLPAGEYVAKMKFAASNSADKDSIAGFTLKVKDHWLWAVIVLTMAIIFSFITNKWLNTRRKKLEIRNKVAELYPAWLRMEPPSLGAVKAKSTLKLVEDLSQKLYIANSELMDQKLEEVKVLIKYLDRSRQLRKKIAQSGITDMKYRRAIKNYRQISDKIGSDKIDEALGAEIEAGLEKLEAWFLPDQFDFCYGESLKKDVRHLLDEIGDAKEFPKPHRADFEEILAQLKQIEQEKPGTVELENQYAVVKVLWERRHKPEVLKGLLKNYRENESVNLLFNEVDKLEWGNLKSIHLKEELKFISPQIKTLGKTETFQPIWFRIFPENPRDANNYLFKHGLRYKWEITIFPQERLVERILKKLLRKIGKADSTVTHKLTPITSEPRVVQFIPLRSTINYKVTVYHNGLENIADQIEIEHRERLRIHHSTIFSINKAFKNIELFAVVAAWLVAGISGLLTFYYKNDTFGQISDYLTLFLWGAGVDQTKNFIQNFQVYTKKDSGNSV